MSTEWRQRVEQKKTELAARLVKLNQLFTDSGVMYPDAAIEEVKLLFEDYFEERGQARTYPELREAIGPILDAEFERAFSKVFDADGKV